MNMRLGEKEKSRCMCLLLAAEAGGEMQSG